MLHTPETFSFEQLRRLRELSVTPADVSARYLLLHLHHRHPKQWLSSPRLAVRPPAGHGNLLRHLADLGVACSVKQSERLRGLDSVTELFQHYYFRGVVQDSHEGLVGWLEARYPLILRRDIPTPDEMLEIQCEGRRFVSLLLDDGEQFQAYGRHRDACDFLLHDFEHAHKFFGDPESHRGQVHFFRRLKASLKLFARWEDGQFVRDLDYLKADMNSHPVHLIKYLKAIVLSAEMRRTGSRWPELNDFWTEVFARWEMQADVCESALKINHPEFEREIDLRTVAAFFSCGPAAAGAR